MHHCIGNHCLAMPRSVLTQRLRIEGACYRTVLVARGWRLIILDTTEVWQGFVGGHSALRNSPAVHRCNCCQMSVLRACGLRVTSDEWTQWLS